MILNVLRLRLENLEDIIQNKVRQYEQLLVIFNDFVQILSEIATKWMVSLFETISFKIAQLMDAIRDLFQKMAVKCILGHFKLVQCLAPSSISSALEEQIESLFKTKHAPVPIIVHHHQFAMLKSKILNAHSADSRHLPDSTYRFLPISLLSQLLDRIESWSKIILILALILIFMFSFYQKRRKNRRNKGATRKRFLVLQYALHGPSWLLLLSGLFSLFLCYSESFLLKYASDHLKEMIIFNFKDALSRVCTEGVSLLEREFIHLKSTWDELEQFSKSTLLSPLQMVEFFAEIFSESIEKYFFPAFKQVFSSGPLSWAANAILPITSILKCVAGIDSNSLLSSFQNPLEKISSVVAFPSFSSIFFWDPNLLYQHIHTLLISVIDKSISHEYLLTNPITNDELLFSYILIGCSLGVIIGQTSLFASFLSL